MGIRINRLLIGWAVTAFCSVLYGHERPSLEGGFVAGTKIATPAGLQNIEAIKVGDLVSSCDQSNASCVERRVEAAFGYFSSSLVRLQVEGRDGDNAVLTVASNHLFFLPQTGKWEQAGRLKVSQLVLDAEFSSLVILANEPLEGKEQLVYNFTVEGLHNFYVTESRILVHNFNPLVWITEKVFHSGLTNATFLAGVGSLASLLRVKAPYGRHIREGWGQTISNKLGWVLMELPSVAVFASTFFMGEHSDQLAPQVMAAMWLTHYTYRTFIYPSLIRTKGKKMPLALALTGAGFNSMNSYINARALSEFSSYPEEWLKDPRFAVGAMLFVLGMSINVESDQRLINLREAGDTSYKIPTGGLFNHVSCPNYLGEMVEWVGWAVATWSKPGAAFAFYTSANLVPRALANHKWYREKFGDEYPPQRMAVIPKIL